MLKQTISFTDFNDNSATTVEYFNLTKNEIIDLEESIPGGLTTLVRRVDDNPTAAGVLELLKVLAKASYGVKSEDGKFFRKSEQITDDFVHSAFYDDFLFGLIENDAAKGLDFIKGIIPVQLLNEAEKQIAANAAGQDYQPDARALFASAPPSQFQPQAETRRETREMLASADPNLAGATPDEVARFKAWQDAENAKMQAMRQQVEEPPTTGYISRPQHEQ